MHIQERTNTTLTTCTKMTEEVDRRHGVNGNSSGKVVSEDVPVHSSAHSSTGGRLKFFKDGKFILELVRGCAREGERSGWVSVPRKTFWPPAPPPAPPTPPAHSSRHERAASLSVSDDNSSIQSSPWQRDHCWKQSNPRKNISKELALYYCRPSTLLNSTIKLSCRSKRRRPYDTTHSESLVVNGTRKVLSNGVCVDKKKNGDVADGGPCKGEDAVDGGAADDVWTDYDREKYYHMKLKKPYQYHKLRVYKKTKPSKKRKDLIKIVDKLREKIASLPAPVNAKLANCKQEHAMVSPRKRILRELERVSLEDQSTKRRAKTVPALSTASYPPAAAPAPGPSHARPPAKSVSSYSISSLLSIDDAPARRSPQSRAALGAESPDPRASPDGRYRHAAPALGSPAAGFARGYGAAFRAGGRDDWRDAYPAPAPAYGAYPAYLPPPLYRAPAPLWMHYALPPGPWAPLPHPLLTDRAPKDEPTSDLPLNLSKH